MLPKAEIAHHTRGRTRLRIPERRRDVGYLTATGRKLEVIPGVARAAVNPTTGSILLEHDLSLEDLKKIGQDRALFAVQDFRDSEPLAQTFGEEINHLVARADEHLRSLSSGELDARSVVAGGLLGLSLYQWRRKDFLPAGMMLALMALDVIKR